MITMSQFAALTDNELALMVKAPVLISMLAAAGDDKISKQEEAEVIRQAHLKTYTGIDELQPYYEEVNANFRQNYDAAVALYTPFTDATRANLTNEVSHINDVISKLDKGFANILRKSLGDYARHVKYADKKFVGNYLFPFTTAE